jgi:hypothetical protein
MGAYHIDFDADKTAAAKSELTLHIGKDKQRTGIRKSSWPGPTGYTRVSGSPQSGSPRPPGANRVRLLADHLDRG